MKERNKVILFIFIILIAIYQDFPAVNLIGEIARSPFFLFVIPAILYILSFKKIVVSKYTQYFIFYFLYLFSISVIFLPIVWYESGSYIILKENIFIKTTKILIYPLFAIIFYHFIYVLFKKYAQDLMILFKAVIFVQFIIAVYLFFEIIYLKTPTVFIPFLHSTAEKYYRVRLLTAEESWVGNIITFFVFVPVFFANYLKVKRKQKILVYLVSGFIFLYYTLVSESKGYMLLIIVSTLPLIIKYIYSHEKLKKAFSFLIIFIFGLSAIVLINLNQFISSQFNNSTFGTRLTSVFAAIQIFVTHPFGVGWSGFIYYLPDSIKSIIVSGSVGSFDLSEIKAYLVISKSLSTKSEFFDNLICGGIGYLYFFYKFFIKRSLYFSSLKDRNVIFLLIPLNFAILAGLVYITYHIKYEVWLLMAILDIMQIKYMNEEK